MLFITAAYRQTYTLNPSIRELIAIGNGHAAHGYEGLHASSNNSRIIDTDQEAQTYGWSPEEKIQMEKHLLSHPDFGRSRLVDSGREENGVLVNAQVFELFLAPGQVIPDEYQEFCEAQTWYQRWAASGDLNKVLMPTAAPTSERTCSYTRMWGGSALKCPEPALEGEDYCEHHLKAEVPAEVGSS